MNLSAEHLSLLIILIIISILFLFASNYLIEGLRTNPESRRHPLETKDNWKSQNIKQSDIISDVNADIDSYLKLYFDERYIPTMNLVDLYEKYFVENDNINEETKKKLKDVCYYFIYFVIPNMPTVKNPNPVMDWPKLEFLADTWSSYNFKYPGMSGTFSTSFKTGSTGNGDSGGASTWDPNSNNTGTTSGGGSSESGGSSGEGGNKNCAGGCPSNCFSLLLDKLNQIKNATKKTITPGAATVGVSTPGSSKAYGWGSSTGDTSDESTDLPVPDPLAKPLYGYYITNKPTKSNSEDGQLNDFIQNDILKMHFNIDGDNKPTPYAISTFNNYVLYRNPIDDNHKNKLRDLMYYFIENIIPGLPTNAKPNSYVEWRPIYWLTNSYI